MNCGCGEEGDRRGPSLSGPGSESRSQQDRILPLFLPGPLCSAGTIAMQYLYSSIVTVSYSSVLTIVSCVLQLFSFIDISLLWCLVQNQLRSLSFQAQTTMNVLISMTIAGANARKWITAASHRDGVESCCN